MNCETSTNDVTGAVITDILLHWQRIEACHKPGVSRDERDPECLHLEMSWFTSDTPSHIDVVDHFTRHGHRYGGDDVGWRREPPPVRRSSQNGRTSYLRLMTS